MPASQSRQAQLHKLQIMVTARSFFGTPHTAQKSIAPPPARYPTLKSRGTLAIRSLRRTAAEHLVVNCLSPAVAKHFCWMFVDQQ